jgi:S1-C subfamily serine protease
MSKKHLLHAALLTFGTLQGLSGEDLVTRHTHLACAVVRIQSDNGFGTAFFVNSTGRMATAAHVLYDRKYHIQGGEVVAAVTAKPNLSVLFPKDVRTPLKVPTPGAEDGKRALLDLALVETGLPTPCFIPLGDSDAVKVGQHLIAIGFPGPAPSDVLYEGFLSSRAARIPLAFGVIEERPGLSYAPHYEVFRVQMPITAGASGSPVITDLNTAVGVLSEVPVILTRDVQRIAEAFGGTESASSGVSLSGFDVTKTLGELAWIVSQFETPGAGLAVPTSALGVPPLAIVKPGAGKPPKP